VLRCYFCRVQCALEVLDEQQQLREERYNCSVEVTAAAAAAAGAGDGSGSHCCTEIQQQLDQMIEAARTVGKGYKLVSKLPLTNLHLLQQQMLQHQQQLEARDAASEDSCTAAIITADAAVDSAAEAGAGSGSCKGEALQSTTNMAVQV
jgi:hypothetical protein